ncbi:hypothetical protein, partial [Azospirillum baldaniorum]|uniref:hypothetical protein n=1 Tax=Azospirillum baldaniorum TaxID=1064539 RepID=UPI001B3C0AAB
YNRVLAASMGSLDKSRIGGTRMGSRQEYVMPNPLDWLIDRYSDRPRALQKMIDLADRLPARWDTEQESRYRDRMTRLASTVLEVANDMTVADKPTAFRERFTAATALEIQRFVVYLVYLSLPNRDWPQPVAWDSEVGCPRVYHLDSMLEHAERLVLTLVALWLQGEV